MIDPPAEPTVTATPPPGGTATAVSSSAVQKERVITHEQASDIPETNWFWRRWFAFIVSALLLYQVDWIARHSHDIPTLRMIAQDALRLVGLGMLLYLAGASAESLARIIGAVRTTRKEIITEKPAEAGP